MELNARTREILFTLIHSFIGSGDPVASRTVVQKSNLNLSPATVRNILADLDEMGFLMQPHPSAGRIPTDLGYRFYVDTLMEHSDLSAQERERIAGRYRSGPRAAELDGLLLETSRILSEVSHYIGVVLAPKLSDVTYSHLELIRMNPGEILVVLVSESGIVHSRRITMEQDLPQEVLDDLTCSLNEDLCGLTLKEVRERIVEKMRADMRRYRELLKKVFMDEALAESDLSHSRIYFDGASNILDLPEFSDLEKMKRLFHAIEKKSMMVRLLDRSIRAEGVVVYIGSETPLRVLEDCSLITANYRSRNKVMGTLGIIGPKRMDYAKIIPIVDYTAKHLSRSIDT